MLEFIGLLYVGIPVAGVGFAGWALTRYVKSREATAVAPAKSSAEIIRLEEQLDALQRELTLLREQQEFTEKLLDRPKNGRE